VPEAENLEALNEKLLRQCMAYGSHKMAGRSRTVAELYEEEKRHLLSQPEVIYSNAEPREARADKYATVTVDKNRYSVPWRHAGRKLNILLHVERVEIFSGGKKLAVHERLFGNNKWGLMPEHYLELIQQRPMSFNSARPIRQWREKWPESLHRLLESFCYSQGETKGTKDFISVLMLYSRYQPSEVEAAVELALEKKLSTSQGVEHLLIYANEAGNIILPLSNWLRLPSPDVSVYGVLGGVQ
jgi:hypothetical protein